MLFPTSLPNMSQWLAYPNSHRQYRNHDAVGYCIAAVTPGEDEFIAVVWAAAVTANRLSKIDHKAPATASVMISFAATHNATPVHLLRYTLCTAIPPPRLLTQLLRTTRVAVVVRIFQNYHSSGFNVQKYSNFVEDRRISLSCHRGIRHQ